MKWAGKIISDVLTMVWLVLAIGFLLLFVLGIKPYIVLSGSMEPAIRTGSLCMINEQSPYEQIKKGDVIAFWQGEMRVTHRVLQVHPEGLETKGDANDVSDGVTTTKENYVGKTVCSIPFMGYAFQFMRSKEGIAVSVGFFTVVIIGAAVFHELKYKENSI